MASVAGVFRKLGGKEGRLTDVDRLSQEYNSVGSQRANAIKGVDEWLAALQELVHGEVPEADGRMEDVCTQIRHAILTEQHVVRGQCRAAEDLGDISARNVVIVRLENNLHKARKRMMESRERIQSIHRRQEAGGGNPRDAEELAKALRTAIAEKREALEETILATEELVAARRGFAAMRVRRLRHCYDCLGGSLGVGAESGAQAWAVAAEAVRAARVRVGRIVSGEDGFTVATSGASALCSVDGRGSSGAALRSGSDLGSAAGPISVEGGDTRAVYAREGDVGSVEAIDDPLGAYGMRASACGSAEVLGLEGTEVSRRASAAEDYADVGIRFD